MIKVGDTVSYTPPTGRTSTVATANSGYSSSQSFTTSNSNVTTWKVWKIDSTNNKIEILSSDSTATPLYLTGATGYNQGPGIMNKICSDLYSNSSKGITSRSFDVVDIEEAMEETLGIKIGTTAFNNKLKSLNSPQYGTTCTPTYKNVPNYYTQANITSQQNNDLRPGSNTKTGATYRNGFTVKYTAWYIYQGDMAANIGQARANVIGSRRGWLASHMIYAGTNVCFYNPYFYGGMLGYTILYKSNGENCNDNGCLSPLSTLGSSISLQNNSGVWLVQ